MALRFVHWRGADGRTHYLYAEAWALCFPPLILAVNIAEAVIRDFQVFSFGLGRVASSRTCGPCRGVEHHERHRRYPQHRHHLRLVRHLHLEGPVEDAVWPDMIWAWIIAYDLWNFAYTYNCISDHSAYMASRCCWRTITFFIKKGVAAAPRADAGAVDLFVMTVPQFADVLAIPPRTTPRRSSR